MPPLTPIKDNSLAYGAGMCSLVFVFAISYGTLVFAWLERTDGSVCLSVTLKIHGLFHFQDAYYLQDNFLAIICCL